MEREVAYHLMEFSQRHRRLKNLLAILSDIGQYRSQQSQRREALVGNGLCATGSSVASTQRVALGVKFASLEGLRRGEGAGLHGVAAFNVVYALAVCL